jgi:hypothetical protein
VNEKLVSLGSGCSSPAARRDGWAGDLSNFHFDGLAHPGPRGYFPGREPLSGWRDNTPAALEAQLRWAHADGIGFFVFDWFNNPDPGNGPINMAHANYLQLRNHDGVGFALAYIGNDGFGVPLDALPAVADRWVTEDFLNPDYVRIDGKPLLVVYEINDAAQLWGGAAGVNKGIEIIQQAAKRHGLPGVFVVGTHQEPAEDGTSAAPTASSSMTPPVYRDFFGFPARLTRSAACCTTRSTGSTRTPRRASSRRRHPPSS